MASGYELPDIGNGKKAAQVWVQPGVPQLDWFTEPIWVQANQYINIGVKMGTDAQDMLTLMGFDYTAYGKWFDLQAFAALQWLRPEETEDYQWRDVKKLVLVVPGEEIVEGPTESCWCRFGVKAADYTTGQAILRLGTS